MGEEIIHLLKNHAPTLELALTGWASVPVSIEDKGRYWRVVLRDEYDGETTIINDHNRDAEREDLVKRMGKLKDQIISQGL